MVVRVKCVARERKRERERGNFGALASLLAETRRFCGG